MVTIDLKDAYYSVPVNEDSRKYLKFLWNSSIYEFKSLPNGYRDAPRLFTKIMKPIAFGTLVKLGHASVVYSDDSYLLGTPNKQCRLIVILAVKLVSALGCTVHQI